MSPQILHACGSGTGASISSEPRWGSPGDVLSHRPAGGCRPTPTGRARVPPRPSRGGADTVYRRGMQPGRHTTRGRGAQRTCACRPTRAARREVLPARQAPGAVACPRCADADLSGAKSDDGRQEGAEAHSGTVAQWHSAMRYLSRAAAARLRDCRTYRTCRGDVSTVRCRTSSHFSQNQPPPPVAHLNPSLLFVIGLNVLCVTATSHFLIILRMVFGLSQYRILWSH